MKKRRTSYEEEGKKNNNERWLLTYSDMITLLLALFIIMYSMSTIDVAKFKAVADSMGQALNNPKVAEPPGPNEPGDSEISDMELLARDVKAYIKRNNLEGQVDVKGTDSYVKIDLKDSLLFIPDSDQLIDGNSTVLLELKDLMQAYYSQMRHISIRGHTAFVPGTNEQFSWKLSADRALTVVNFLAANGMSADKFSIEGYSHYSPVGNNDTEKGRARNRRVEIYITQ